VAKLKSLAKFPLLPDSLAFTTRDNPFCIENPVYTSNMGDYINKNQDYRYLSILALRDLCGCPNYPGK
jgi:hypothetical protein